MTQTAQEERDPVTESMSTESGTMLDPPSVVYLNYIGNGYPESDACTKESLTWHLERTSKQDLLYVRADLISTIE